MYDRQLPHLAFIPTENYPFLNFVQPRLFFRTLPADEFEYAACDHYRERSPDGFTVGQPSQKFMKNLSKDVQSLSGAIDEAMDTWATESSLASVIVNARHLRSLMIHNLHRLQLLHLTVSEARRTLADCQRCWLELFALTLYMQIFAPTSLLPPPHHSQVPEVLDTIGTFVDNERDLHTLHTAGVPVWYIRSLSELHESERFDASSIECVIPRHCLSQYHGTSGFADLTAIHTIIRQGVLPVKAVRDVIYSESWRGPSCTFGTPRIGPLPATTTTPANASYPMRRKRRRSLSPPPPLHILPHHL